MIGPGGRLKLSQFAAAAAVRGFRASGAGAGGRGMGTKKKGDARVSPNYFSIRNRCFVAAYFSTIIRLRISRCSAWQKLVQ